MTAQEHAGRQSEHAPLQTVTRTRAPPRVTPLDPRELTSPADAASGGPNLTGHVSSESLQVGQQLAGRWTIVKRLGIGGMGAVYLAHDPVLARDVAIKILDLDQQRANRRILREARAAAKVKHPNIVEVIDFVSAEPPFLVMEYVEGRALRSVVDEHKRRSAAIPWERSVAIVLQVLEALDAAHQRGVIHRDIKPANVIVCEDVGPQERIKVVDFGVARVTTAAPDDETATVSVSTGPGYVVGTVPYMAPEMQMGAAANARTDLFAVGVMLFELLTGQRPFRGPEMRVQICTAKRPRPSEVRDGLQIPAELDALVVRLLDKEPEARPSSAREAATLLARIAGTSRETSHSGTVRRLLPLALGSAVLALGSFALTIATFKAADTARPEEQTSAPTEPAAGKSTSISAHPNTTDRTHSLAFDSAAVTAAIPVKPRVDEPDGTTTVPSPAKPNERSSPTGSKAAPTDKGPTARPNEASITTPRDELGATTRTTAESTVRRAARIKLSRALKRCVNDAGIWDPVEISIAGAVAPDGTLDDMRTSNANRGAGLVLECVKEKAAQIHVQKPNSAVPFAFRLSYKP